MNSKTVIVDYGMGNLQSVLKKFKPLHSEVIISSQTNEIESASKIVLPGVGHFGTAVNRLKSTGIWEILNHKVLVDKTPILGICLGMHLMAKFSEEGNEEGLGWFDANVVRFHVNDKLKYKVPHIGWNGAFTERINPLFSDVSAEAMYYFVHSYHVVCNDNNDILCTTVYDYSFASGIQKGNIFGLQFHPEKSHDSGALLIKNFIEKIH